MATTRSDPGTPPAGSVGARARVAVALHDSLAAHAAVPVATAIAKALEAEVVVVAVLDSGTAVRGSAVDEHDVRVADILLEVLRAEGLRASLDVRVTDERGIAAAIVAAAEDLQPAVLVLGSHSHSGVTDLVVGRVVYRVARDARCPVLVVPVGAPRSDPALLLTRILLAVQSSARADKLTEAVMKVAAPGADVFVLHVHEVDLPDPQSLAGQVASIVDRLSAAGLQPTALESHTLPHAVPGTILDVSEALGAGLIVLGSSPRSEFGGLIHRSVSHKLLRKACCPVLIVP